MSDYIRRDDILRHYEKCAQDAVDWPTFAVLKSVMAYIEDIPCEDVVRVRHERWDDSGRYTFLNGKPAVRCTGCGACLAEEEYKKNVWNFCSVCGAKMDGGDDDAAD